ncbi:Protein OS-9-like [Porphyridium purpureum]|uniref:Protein OS-9-like n=1 Tax=Porphyridium purpureum TaxID=35688 RepID=A0A5J4YI65_PORPP|nr:Protein OS-9-like [Porphyridium purpureum]|eukprot:POR1384..scf261_15
MNRGVQVGCTTDACFRCSHAGVAAACGGPAQAAQTTTQRGRRRARALAYCIASGQAYERTDRHFSTPQNLRYSATPTWCAAQQSRETKLAHAEMMREMAPVRLRAAVLVAALLAAAGGVCARLPRSPRRAGRQGCQCTASNFRGSAARRRRRRITRRSQACPTQRRQERSSHDAESYTVTTAAGQRMLCKLPPPVASAAPPKPASPLLPPDARPEATNARPGSKPPADDEATRRAKWLHALDLFLARNSKNCFFRVDGWWTYEFCPGKHVRQIHFEDQHSERDEIFLGILDRVADQEARADFLAAKSSTSAAWASGKRKSSGLVPDASRPGSSFEFSQTYIDGTMCDLTGAPRATTVVYRCPKRRAGLTPSKTRVLHGSGDYIESILEVQSCVYVLDFVSEALCEEAQLEDERRVFDIECTLAAGEKAFRGLSSPQSYRRSPWL